MREDNWGSRCHWRVFDQVRLWDAVSEAYAFEKQTETAGL